MNISIRPTHPDDVEGIFRIRQDPRVRVSQYRIRRPDSPDLLLSMLKMRDEFPNYPIKYSTILDGTFVIGYISDFLRPNSHKKICSLGWNLAPNHWGKGIMPLAVAMKLSELFLDEAFDVVFADCFSDNLRCIRVIEKSGFLPHPISRLQAISLAIETLCFRKVLRFRLAAETWKANNNQRWSESDNKQQVIL